MNKKLIIIGLIVLVSISLFMVNLFASADVTTTYEVQNDWGSGAVVNVTIKNIGSSAIEEWNVRWTFPGNQTITNMWNANYIQTGSSVVVSNSDWNSSILSNGSVTFGFNLTYSGSNTDPTNFTVNSQVSSEVSSEDTPAETTATKTSNSPIVTSSSDEELLAFPGAEGYGRFAKGGRGGSVIKVTNLNDSGPGSLRDAIDQTGPRTIVFEVSGVIHLKSKLLITGTKGNDNVYVAGQTAPGKGICISGYTFGMTGGEHVVIRHIRTRVGTDSGNTMDGMGMASANNSIFDHCSISWTIDEAFSSRSGQMITLQRCLISEALNEAGHKNYPEGSQHGYAASISGDIGSFHHNLLAHCAGRNWSLAGGLIHGTLTYAGRLDIRNNVVYNWKHRTTDGGAHEVNFVNNYYKPGPASEVFTALNAQNDGFEGTQRYYFNGNIMENYWNESSQEKGSIESGEPRDYNYLVDEPFFDSYVNTQTAKESYNDVLNDVGCNVPMLDDHDKRVIEETRNGTYTYKGSKTGLPGLPDNEADVGGLENYPEVKRNSDWDTDNDGMPDSWETKHSLNPSNSSDRNNTNLSKTGYTNLEMYLNELAGDPIKFQ
ncbi:MAG: cellulose-binding domain-containing protein [Clostridiales bacterium]